MGAMINTCFDSKVTQEEAATLTQGVQQVALQDRYLV